MLRFYFIFYFVLFSLALFFWYFTLIALHGAWRSLTSLSRVYCSLVRFSLVSILFPNRVQGAGRMLQPIMESVFYGAYQRHSLRSTRPQPLAIKFIIAVSFHSLTTQPFGEFFTQWTCHFFSKKATSCDENTVSVIDCWWLRMSRYSWWRKKSTSLICCNGPLKQCQCIYFLDFVVSFHSIRRCFSLTAACSTRVHSTSPLLFASPLRLSFSAPFLALFLSSFYFSADSVVDCRPDIDQLMRIMALTGTPGGYLLAKLGSDEVIRTKTKQIANATFRYAVSVGSRLWSHTRHRQIQWFPVGGSLSIST